MMLSSWKYIAAGYLLGGLSVGGGYFLLRVPAAEIKAPAYGDCFRGSGNCTKLLGSIDGKNITSANLPPDLQEELLKADSEHHGRITKIVNDVGVRFETARKQGGPTFLPQLRSNHENVVNSISTDDVKRYFEQNKNHYTGLPSGQVESLIRRVLEQQKINATENTALAELKESKRIRVVFPLPTSEKFIGQPPVSAPLQGSGSQFELLFVTDYHCGPCRSLRAPLERIARKYASSLRVRHIFAPAADDHSGAFLAKGAFCANTLEEGRGFDVYNNYASESPVEFDSTGKVRPVADPRASAVASAKKVGLDVSAFEDCLNSQKATNFLKENLKYLTKQDILLIPSLFLNSRRLPLHPQSNLEDILDEVLGP